MVELMQLGERQGFEYAWTYDSHILWQESYATLALAADRTERIKLGHFVTNPGIRDPTITASWYATMQDISDGRSEEHTSELQSPCNLVCRLLLEKKKNKIVCDSTCSVQHRPTQQLQHALSTMS